MESKCGNQWASNDSTPVEDWSPFCSLIYTPLPHILTIVRRHDNCCWASPSMALAACLAIVCHEAIGAEPLKNGERERK